MRTVITSVIIALTIVGGIIFAFNNRDNNSDQTQDFGIILDVRTAEEYVADHIDGAVNLSLDEIQNGKVPTDDKSTKLSVYCRSGVRSAQAAKTLRDEGYDVVDLGGVDTARDKLSK